MNPAVIRLPCDQLASSESFLDFRQQLQRWLLGEADNVAALAQAGLALARAAKALECRPEEILRHLHHAGLKPPPVADDDPWSRTAKLRDRRYTEAVRILMVAWFELEAID